MNRSRLRACTPVAALSLAMITAMLSLPWIVSFFISLKSLSIKSKILDQGQSHSTHLLNYVSIIKEDSTTEENYPSGELGVVVRLGEALVKETRDHELTKSFVGNSLNCTSCHLDSGRAPKAASFIGVASAYPAYSPREDAVITLEDRIINCFIRSENGTKPPNGSKVTVAIAAYITWLSRETPIAMNAERPLGPNHIKSLDVGDYQPNSDRGESLYRDRCAGCHGEDGEGTVDGPPVWGNSSFNDGAGLSKVPSMAAWLKVAMPLDETDLTNEDSFDIAAFVNSHPRPKFEPVVEK